MDTFTINYDFNESCKHINSDETNHLFNCAKYFNPIWHILRYSKDSKINFKIIIGKNVKSVKNLFYETYVSEIKTIDVSNIKDISYMFNGADKLKRVILSGSHNVTSMNGLFKDACSLEETPELDTSNVVSMESMFQNTKNLKAIKKIDTSNVTNMKNMFAYSNIEEIPPLNKARLPTSKKLLRKSV